MFGIEKSTVTGSAAAGGTKLLNSLDKLSESQIGSDHRKLATKKKGIQLQILSGFYAYRLFHKRPKSQRENI
jgi:hypothetical protein